MVLCLAGGVEAVGQTSPARPPAPVEPATTRSLDLTTATTAAPAPFELDSPRLPKGWTFRVDVPVTCAGCAAAGPIVVNPNAPWTMSGTLGFAGERSAVSATVTGQRGSRLPAYMTAAPGLDRPATAGEALLSDTATRWQLSLEGERRLFGARTGPSLSLVGSVTVPIASVGRTFVPRGTTPGLARERAVSPLAAFGGFRVRF